MENLERYLKQYPADSNVMYAHYLIAIIHYERITDEKKDLKPLLNANEKIDFFVKKYPDSEYAIDLKFKRFNSKSTSYKELYIAKYCIWLKNGYPP